MEEEQEKAMENKIITRILFYKWEKDLNIHFSKDI